MENISESIIETKMGTIAFDNNLDKIVVCHLFSLFSLSILLSNITNLYEWSSEYEKHYLLHYYGSSQQLLQTSKG